jgi:hypothetical protein
MSTRKAHLLGFRVKNHVEIVPSCLSYQLTVMLGVVGVNDEADEAPLACSDQMQQFSMSVAPDAHEEAQAFEAGSMRTRARQMDYVGGQSWLLLRMTLARTFS